MPNNSNQVTENWDLKIEASSAKRGLNLRELLSYKDLMLLFVKRDFISLYKQTVLGPLWVVIQPILTTITFYIVFSRIASIGTMGTPPILYYMVAVITWTYFADCVVKTSDTFIVNQNIFGKVYFPRLIVPFSIVITNVIKFGIQFVLFLGIYFFYEIFIPKEVDYMLSWQLILIPLLLVILAVFGLGVGLIISALTTKYRDLRFLIQFGIQLAMFATPVVWPLGTIDPQHQWKLLLNPMAGIIETFKAGFFGDAFAVFEWWALGYSAGFAFIVLFIGMRLFTRIERSFMDTI